MMKLIAIVIRVYLAEFFVHVNHEGLFYLQKFFKVIFKILISVKSFFFFLTFKQMSHLIVSR